MTVTNRVWDTQEGPGFHTWETEFPDTSGSQYDGTGTFGTHTSDYCVARGEAVVDGPASLLTDTFSPVARYPLESGLLDASGNGPDLTVVAGSENYQPGPIAGGNSLEFDGTTFSIRSSGADPNAGAVRLLGNMTVEWLWRTLYTPSTQDVILTLEGTTIGGAANNALFISVFAGGQVYFQYENPENNFNQSVNDSAAVMNDGNWHHVCLVRNVDGGANNVRMAIYLDGILAVESLVEENLPAGGSTSVLWIGNGPRAGDLVGNCRISSVKIIGRDLTQAEIISEHKRWLAPELR